MTRTFVCDAIKHYALQCIVPLIALSKGKIVFDSKNLSFKSLHSAATARIGEDVDVDVSLETI